MKLLLVSTSGGHFATMQKLRAFWSDNERVWVTDRQKDTESLLDKEEKVCWLPYQAPRDVKALIRNLPAVFKILRKEKPDLVISTGASLAIGFALSAKILGIKFIYVESVSRSQDLSVSGKMVYLLSDDFYVQWPNLCKKYPKAIYKGMV